MRRMLLIMAAVGLLLLSVTACSVPGRAGGDWGSDGPGGMMGGDGGMMGGGMMGPGMMGGGGSYGRGGEVLSLEEAAEAASRYIEAYGGDLELAEVMEFAQNFYAEVEEKSTGIHAMELLIDKYSGDVYPEMGPNLMWNTKYGMMGGPYGRKAEAAMPYGPEEARALAQRFLDNRRGGLTVGEPDVFYGYYTLHTLRDERIEGMLSVNGFTGEVWYHTWHGAFVGMQELEHSD